MLLKHLIVSKEYSDKNKLKIETILMSVGEIKAQAGSQLA